MKQAGVLIRRTDALNALSDLYECSQSIDNRIDFAMACDAVGSVDVVQSVPQGAYEQVAWERNIAMLQLKEHGIPFGGIAPDVVKVVRCKDCVHNGVHTCPLCYIEKQALIFINHDPEFFCGCGEAKEEKRRTSFMKYRKKPVVIEAFQYDGDLKGSDGKYYVPLWAVEAFESGVMHYDSAADNTPPDELYIETLEGRHHVSVGDFVIQGVQGELYPCKPDIFLSTYEPVE